MIPRAWVVPRRAYVLLGIPVFAVALVWVAKHIAQELGHLGGTNSFSLLWIFVFGSLVWHLALSWTEPVYTSKSPRDDARLDRLAVNVAVPVFNEDPAALKRGLEALLLQTRTPQRVHVVENGPKSVALGPVREWFLDACASSAVEGVWDHIEEPGKRGAQLHALRVDDWSDVFITMDSDTVADSRCIEEGLKPMLDQRVRSVASVILAYNAQAPLVRLTDAWLLTFQLAVRAAMSRLGCVLVNSGNFALYRTATLRRAVPSYEAEFFRENKVEFSDDSLLTLFAHLEGRTVQQPTSFAFTVLPEKVSHHLRQQLRWMRGSTIRSIWRFRYLPINGFAYWEHLMAWVNFALVSFAFVYLVVLSPVTGSVSTLPLMMLFAVLVAYLTSLRYLTIRRSDQSLASQLLTWSLSPLMLVWTAVVLRSLRLYAICTCWRTGWGTRSEIEVFLSDPDRSVDVQKSTGVSHTA